MIGTDRLEDIRCDLRCVAAAMVAACHDASGRESPVLVHFARCVGGISAAMDDAVEAIFVKRNKRMDDANNTD